MSRSHSSEIITDAKGAWKKIIHAVKVTPTMVFSVIGDSYSFVPRPWPRRVFQTALIEAAKSGGDTWILYSGNGQGVSKAVRDAYWNYENRELGERFDNIPQSDRDRHIKLIRFTDGLVVEGQQTDNEIKEVYAETVVHCSGEINSFMLQFEKFVSEQEVSFFNQRTDFSMPVPIAIIVCEGDMETIAHTAGALQNKLPVIFMKGSGKAADLIMDYLEKYVGIFDLNCDDPSKLSDIVGETVVSCWSLEKSHIPYPKRQNNEERIVITKPHEDNQSEEQPSQDRIIIALPCVDGLAVAGSSITWNVMRNNSIILEEKTIQDLLERCTNESKPDVFNTSPTSLPLYFYFGYQILQESNQWKKSGHILLLEAIKENRCDYVRVLLDQGIKLTTKDLLELYSQTLLCKKSNSVYDDSFQMQWILRQIGKKEVQTLCDQNKDKKAQTEAEHVTESAKKLCRTILRYKEEKENQDSGKNKKVNNIPIICETSDILLWAIFADRKEIAEICWIRGENHIFSGLVCAVLLHKLSKKAHNVKEQTLALDLAEHAKLFEQRCINILDRMYKEEPKDAIEVITDEANLWDIQGSPLAIAHDNFIYDVVAHICSQKSMNTKWYNNLAPDVKLFLKSAIRKPRKFIEAPFTKYILNYLMFFSVLVMYSAFVLTSIHTNYYDQGKGKIFEYYVYFWAIGDFIEELISCFGCVGSKDRFNRGYYRRLKRHLYDFWNAVDLLSYILLIIALFVRHFYQSENFTVARRLFSLSLLVMYLRFLEVFLVHRTLGPTLIMIKEMLKDLLSFLFIAVFVILGVGIYYHANLFPDYQDFWIGKWTDWRIWDVVYYPYWQIYAELNLDYLNAEEKPDDEPSPHKDWSVIAIAGVYLLFAHLLLVNLVIAMFSYTFERVQQISEKLWWYERYTAVNDYERRIPAPFNLFVFAVCKCRCVFKNQRSTKVGDSFKDIRKRHYRKNLQKIIALSIYNKI